MCCVAYRDVPCYGNFGPIITWLYYRGYTNACMELGRREAIIIIYTCIIIYMYVVGE